MNKYRRSIAVSIVLMFAGAAAATLEIDQFMAANATPSQFDLFVRTTEPADTWVEVFADAAGAVNLAGTIGIEVSPVYTGDPSLSTNYYRRADRRAVQDGAEAMGLALYRVSACDPMTTYYCRVHATNVNGSATWPASGLLAVTTELENDFVLESRQLLLQLDPSVFAPSAEGAIGVLTAVGASGPIASIVGDGVVTGNEVYFDLSSLFSDTTHVNMEPSGVTAFEVTLYGPSSQTELMASFNVAFSNLAEVAMADTGFLGSLIILDIRSIAGQSVPAPGLYTNTFGSVITCSVTNTLYSDNGTQWSLAGWSLAGLEASTGATASVEIEMTNSVVLTWQWNTKYWLSTGAGDYGQVAEPDQWVDAGTVVTLTALPDMYYHIDVWTGDVAGATAAGDLLEVPMTQPRSIFALFAENTTGNGVPQRWLYDHGFSNAWENAGMLDHDGDSMLTWEEWVAGTSPTNIADALLVDFATDIGASTTLVWPSVSNRVYKVWRSVDLREGFWQVSGTLPATPPANTYRERTAPIGMPTYYRISVERQ